MSDKTGISETTFGRRDLFKLGAVAAGTAVVPAWTKEAIAAPAPERIYEGLRKMVEPGQLLESAWPPYRQLEINGATLVTFTPSSGEGKYAIRLCQGTEPGLVLVDDKGMSVRPNAQLANIENASAFIKSGLLKPDEISKLFLSPNLKPDAPTFLAMGGSVWEWNGVTGIAGVMQAEMAKRGIRLIVGAINGDGGFQHKAKVDYLLQSHTKIDGALLELHPTDVSTDMQRQIYRSDTVGNMINATLMPVDKGAIPFSYDRTFYDKEVFGNEQWFTDYQTLFYQITQEKLAGKPTHLIGAALFSSASADYVTQRWQPLVNKQWATDAFNLDPLYPVPDAEGKAIYPHPNPTLARDMGNAVVQNFFGSSNLVGTEHEKIMANFYSRLAAKR